ncbi:MBOAT family O-acyltransferase [Paenibacillus sp. KN14-4R]|uniref:MBOAT family O-acyltransferase n=1 Tax=Paenibacillus sp. KN14-4R TaxID=3445773 RepID=UPI003FA0129E
MQFSSLLFIGFLITVFALYYAAPKLRLPMFAVANAVFYAVAGVGYLVLFFTVVALAYVLSRKLDSRHGRKYLIAGLVLVIGNLVFFKYSLFLLHNLENIFSMHLNVKGTIFENLILPIGISFYTFQLIAYMVDVYQKKLSPSKNLLEFWVFISLFAHSMAGPILRGKEFFPQLRAMNTVRFNHVNIKVGLFYIGMGLCKKVLLANLLEPHVRVFFERGGELGGAEAWVAAYLFAFQIYFDFSAYSEMAIGIGHLFGLRLDVNFRTPYISSNPSEFWRRWHITLSNWIRDYIYIPLGGSRTGKVRVYVNLILAMTISGLWHGAAWKYIVWGFYQGVLSAGHRGYSKWLTKIGLGSLTGKLWYKLVTVFIFFHMTVIGWVFFRAANMTDALHMVKNMLYFNPLHIPSSLYKYLIMIVLLYALHVLEYVIVQKFRSWSFVWQSRIPTFIRSAVYTGIILICLFMLLKGEQSTFIYFQF